MTQRQRQQDTENLVFIVDDDPDDRQIILDGFLRNHAQIDYEFIDSADELLNKLYKIETELPALKQSGYTEKIVPPAFSKIWNYSPFHIGELI